jgi:hypothetical protein
MKICLYRLNTVEMCACHCVRDAKWQRVLIACENLRLLMLGKWDVKIEGSQ